MEDQDLSNKVWNELEMFRMKYNMAEINETNAMDYFKESPFYKEKKTQ